MVREQRLEIGLSALEGPSCLKGQMATVQRVDGDGGSKLSLKVDSGASSKD